MYNDKERRFIEYWEASRLREKKWQNQLLWGIPVGLIFSTPILLILFTGRFWYMRAEAVAHTMVNPWVLIVAVLIITVFVALFYKKQQWERKEEYYQQLMSRGGKEKQEEEADNKQQ